jgi:hypothetical protein
MSSIDEELFVFEKSQLAKFEENLLAAEGCVKSARLLRETEITAEKLAPKKPLLVRIKDWFFEPKPTLAQIAVRDAEAGWVVEKTAARKAAEDWVKFSVGYWLARNAVDTEKHQSLKKSLENTQKRERKVRRLRELVVTANSRFIAAKRDCESASSMEMLDLMSNNKGISLLSTLQTSDASSSISSARRALRELMDVMPKRVGKQEIENPDDWLDLAFDLSFDPIFDVFSWINMGKLDDAAKQCEKAINSLSALLKKLDGTIRGLKIKIDNDTAAMKAIEKPYIDAALAELPSKLSESFFNQ